MRTASEWSAEFDLLYDNITSHKAPGLEDYEKSVFLTRAQESIVVALYNGAAGPAFEGTEAMTDYLAPLVKTELPAEDDIASRIHIVPGSVIYKMPSDLLFRTMETCSLSGVVGCNTAVDAVVVPVTLDEYWRTSRNPFKGANANRVLRLTFAEQETGAEPDTSQYSERVYAELIIPKGTAISRYSVTYIRKPHPIIIGTIPEGLSINGYTNATAPEDICELSEVLHETILAEAVKMAKAVWAA